VEKRINLKYFDLKKKNSYWQGSGLFAQARACQTGALNNKKSTLVYLSLFLAKAN